VAIGFARRVRPLVVLAALAAVAALAALGVVAPTLASATPHAQPSIPSVQKRLGALALQNSQLVEKYDHAQVLVHKRDQAARAAEAVAAKADATYRAAHTRFSEIIQAQYESDEFGAAGALLDSSSNTNYLDRLQTLNMVSTHTAQVVADMASARAAALGSAKRAATLLASAKQERDSLAQKRNAVEKQIKKYKALLGTLDAAQQAAYQRSINPSVSPADVHVTSAGSSAAHQAVEFALAQVGKPYVFGAAGPDSYDCSGLTMAAWASAGVSLPHSAADQYNYGTHVSESELEPGDLIFFYQPIGHVTIYIGDGMMVSAPTEGENVSVVPLSSFQSDYVGATRLA
jgi:cell wall-associated NlpC family hydrolase